MSTTVTPDAAVFAAAAAFTAADDEYVRMIAVASCLPFEQSGKMTERASEARALAGEVLAQAIPTTLDGHAARALAVYRSSRHFIEGPENFCEAGDHLPANLIHSVVQGLANVDSEPVLTASDADAELIRQCDEFADLSRRIGLIYKVEFAYDNDGAEGAAEPLQRRRGELLDLICEAKAITIEGLRARGRMMVAYQDGAPHFPHGAWPDSMIEALLRDLTGPGSVAPAEAGLSDARGGYIGLRRREGA